jgi:hypothetical protein
MTQLWETIGSKFAERWLPITGPALLYWLGGMLAWSASTEGAQRLEALTATLTSQPPVIQLVLIAAGVLAILASGVVVQRLTLPALRFLAGYWPAPLETLRVRGVGRERARLERMQADWMALAAGLEAGAGGGDLQHDYVVLDGRLRRLPAGHHRLMPTRLGNILRAAESRPYDKYGLDAVRCFPHLWLLLPEGVRDELAAARGRLDGAVAACLWGVLFIAWGGVNPWAIPIGAAVALGSWRWWLPERAEAFGDLLEAAFDLYRPTLYQALRWPLPASPAAERESGMLLTEYVWRGLDTPRPLFTGTPEMPG